MKYFFVIIKINSLNWEILTKNLVTFKSWDGVRGYGGSLKNLILGGFTKNQYIGIGLPQKGGVFLRGVDTPMHIMDK